MSGGPQRYVVLTPGIAGGNGIAALARLVVRALQMHPDPIIEVLSLAESGPPATLHRDLAGTRFVGANGSKPRFIAGALRAAWHSRPNTQVICLHVHLGPAALPLAWRGAQLLTILCGIEAWKPLSDLQRRAVMRSHTLMAISEHTARRFRAANASLRDRPVHVCHPGVPAASNEAVAEPVSFLEGSDRPTALIVGRMAAEERYKGHDLLLDVWSRLSSEVPDARLAVVGDGDDRDRLQARAAQLGLSSQVVFLGRVSEAALAALYAQCTFFVMPSRDEGFGLVFLEAMRAGKACIGASGAASEIIKDGKTGLLVNPDRPEDVFQAVRRLFREPATRDRMGRAGAQRLATHFTEACFQQRFLALLGTVPQIAPRVQQL